MYQIHPGEPRVRSGYKGILSSQQALLRSDHLQHPLLAPQLHGHPHPFPPDACGQGH